jgi:ribA/ribD-fused uncharacterized protein
MSESYIRDNASLITAMDMDGYKPEFIFFWNGMFSQWYPSEFIIDDFEYPSAEHYMMIQKAILFDDFPTAYKMLGLGITPARVKRMGRAVSNFNENVWNKHKFQIVVDGSFAKFTQNEVLKEHILSTDDKVIVEASAFDTVWGIGMTANALGRDNPKVWRGENLLGYALMEARDLIRTEYED